MTVTGMLLAPAAMVGADSISSTSMFESASSRAVAGSARTHAGEEEESRRLHFCRRRQESVRLASVAFRVPETSPPQSLTHCKCWPFRYRDKI